MLIRPFNYLNDGIAYVIDSELDNESKPQIIKNLVNLCQGRRYLDIDGLKHLKEYVKKRVKELRGKE